MAWFPLCSQSSYRYECAQLMAMFMTLLRMAGSRIQKWNASIIPRFTSPALSLHPVPVKTLQSR